MSDQPLSFRAYTYERIEFTVEGSYEIFTAFVEAPAEVELDDEVFRDWILLKHEDAVRAAIETVIIHRQPRLAGREWTIQHRNRMVSPDVMPLIPEEPYEDEEWP